MKKISIIFVSVLSIAAFTGCKKKGGDCAGTINGMMDRMMADGMKTAGDKMTPEMKKAGEEMMKKMSEPMIKTCNDDKWSAEALKCMDDAKDEASAKKCDSMLTPEQNKHMEKVMGDAMGGMMGADHAMDKAAPDGSAAMAGSGSAAPSMAGSAAPAAAGAGDLPAECADYKAAIDKLASCDKLPKEARDSMKSAFDQASTSWAGLPAEAKASLASACKAGADATKQAAAVCN